VLNLDNFIIRGFDTGNFFDDGLHFGRVPAGGNEGNIVFPQIFANQTSGVARDAIDDDRLFLTHVHTLPNFYSFAFGDLHAHAAVDRQAGTRDEAGLMGTKENSGVGHVADLAQSAQWRLLDDRCDSSACVRRESCDDDVVGQLHAHIGGDKPGIETVDSHS
jgi:hypothetical protein